VYVLFVHSVNGGKALKLARTISKKGERVKEPKTKKPKEAKKSQKPIEKKRLSIKSISTADQKREEKT
jgi:hypothetical protein